MIAREIVQSMFLSAANLRSVLDFPQQVYSTAGVESRVASLIEHAEREDIMGAVKALGNSPVHHAITREQVVQTMVTHFNRMVVYGKRPDGRPYKWCAANDF
jgi:hypothetical protein